METIRTKIKSSKGNLAAVISYPEAGSDKLAVLCSGYLDSKDYKHLAGLAEMLCEEGYVVVRFDATGIWESDGDISDYSTTQYLEDIGNVIDHMLEENHYNHILLGGHSRGGMVSIIHAAKDKRISLVLGIMPATKNIMTAEKRAQWKSDGFRISERDLPEKPDENIGFKVPFSHVEDREKYDTVESVKMINVPIIMIAGELDDVVLPKDVEDIFDNANEPKKFILIPGIDHDYRHNDSEIDFVNGKIIHELIQKLNFPTQH